MQDQDLFTYPASEIVSIGLLPLTASEVDVFGGGSNSVSFLIGPLALAVESADMLSC